MTQDQKIRQLVFNYLAELSAQYGDVLPWKRLSQGVQYDGERVPLLGPQGIFKPRLMEYPLSIATSPNSPYDDGFATNGLLLYKYRGENPDHPDNVGLRRAMELKLPLAYMHGIAKGKYVVSWPVYIVSDQPQNLSVTVAVDDRSAIRFGNSAGVAEDASARRRYITTQTKVRLHQKAFREKVLSAYRQQCALCNLKHTALLDAAHIIPDSMEAGRPVVNNGLSLCKIHHAAYDQNILGIRPDHVVEIRTDILKEVDGPMLRYGLQEMHDSKIVVPRKPEDRPSKDGLEERYELFRSAS